MVPVTATEERAFLLWLAAKAKRGAPSGESGKTRDGARERRQEAPVRRF